MSNLVSALDSVLNIPGSSPGRGDLHMYCHPCPGVFSFQFKSDILFCTFCLFRVWLL